MPKFIRHKTPFLGWTVGGGLILAYGYGLWHHPLWLGGFTLSFVIWSLLLNRFHRRHLAKLAAERPQDSICTFARDFETRKSDTWVVRAVYEQLQEKLRPEHSAFPLRASDRLLEDLKLDEDDLDFDLSEEISQRTARSSEPSKMNPHYGKVRTVGDLVAFFCAQPKQAAPAA